jgi:hypothetical protein
MRCNLAFGKGTQESCCENAVRIHVSICVSGCVRVRARVRECVPFCLHRQHLYVSFLLHLSIYLHVYRYDMCINACASLPVSVSAMHLNIHIYTCIYTQGHAWMRARANQTHLATNLRGRNISGYYLEEASGSLVGCFGAIFIRTTTGLCPSSIRVRLSMCLCVCALCVVSSYGVSRSDFGAILIRTTTGLCLFECVYVCMYALCGECFWRFGQ